MSSVYAEWAGSELSEDAEISWWSFCGYKHFKYFFLFWFWLKLQGLWGLCWASWQQENITVAKDWVKIHLEFVSDICITLFSVTYFRAFDFHTVWVLYYISPGLLYNAAHCNSDGVACDILCLSKARVGPQFAREIFYCVYSWQHIVFVCICNQQGKECVSLKGNRKKTRFGIFSSFEHEADTS